MIIKIAQPAGLGDILFCLKIARVIAEQGHKVYWPVIPEYAWIKDYLVFDGITWEDTPNPEVTIPLQLGARIFPDEQIMAAKYKIVGLPYDDWADYFTFKRNHEKENELYDLVVKKEPYCLICSLIGTPPGERNIIIPEDPNLYNVRIFISDKYTPFDWCKVIENATSFKLVDTCFNYLIEKLNVKTDDMKLYPRDLDDLFFTKYMWKRPWKYMKNLEA